MLGVGYEGQQNFRDIMTLTGKQEQSIRIICLAATSLTKIDRGLDFYISVGVDTSFYYGKIKDLSYIGRGRYTEVSYVALVRSLLPPLPSFI